MRREPVNGERFVKAAAGPVQEARHAMTAFIGLSLFSAHPRVEDLLTLGRAVVAEENQHCVLGQSFVREKLSQATEIRVDAGDGGKQVREWTGDLVAVRSKPLLIRNAAGVVRIVGGEIGEKRPLLVFADELHRSIEIHVALEARTGLFLPEAVVEIVIVDAIVAPVVGGAASAAVALAQPFIEPTVDRTIGIITAEVPLAENTGAIAVVAENISHGHLVIAQHVTAVDGAPPPDAVAIATGHQRGSRWGAVGVHMEIRKSNALIRQSVHVRRFQDRISGARQVAVSLVIGKNNHDVGLVGRRLTSRRTRAKATDQCGCKSEE